MPTLKDLLGKDLAGFELQMGYWAELEHGLMGTFPALDAEWEREDGIVVCLEKDLQLEVLALLPKRRYKINEILLLVDIKEKIGFNMMATRDLIGGFKENLLPLHILTREAFERKVKKKDAFVWAHGLC